MKKFGIVDLFAGCGGLTDGFEMHGGYKTVAAVEWEALSLRNFNKQAAGKVEISESRESSAQV